MKLFTLIFSAILAISRALAQTNDFLLQNQANSPMAAFTHSEQIRAECIQGRRLICGKILKVLPDGFVIESGYTNLLRPWLTDSWLIPGTVVDHKGDRTNHGDARNASGDNRHDHGDEGVHPASSSPQDGPGLTPYRDRGD